jgi:hypothetical protein
MCGDMSLGREGQLSCAGVTPDRHDWAPAYLIGVDDLGPILWLNAEMVSLGGARVHIYPKTGNASAPRVILKQPARQARAGLWAQNDWPIADQSVARPVQRFPSCLRSHVRHAGRSPAGLCPRCPAGTLGPDTEHTLRRRRTLPLTSGYRVFGPRI